jgi:hypothetical protein
LPGDAIERQGEENDLKRTPAMTYPRRSPVRSTLDPGSHLSTRRLSLLSPLLVLFFAPPALAQYAPAPTAYTVTEANAMFGPPVTTTTYRDGQVAVVDRPSSHSRSYYDLATGRTYTWSTAEADPQCGSGTFSGDWGDPLQTGDLTTELAKLHPRDLGTELLNGIRARVVEADDPQGGKSRLWIDAAFGEVIKWVGAGADKKVSTLLEMKSLTTGKPAAAKFALPPRCARLASQPLPPSEAQRIATLTGSPPGTYVTAVTGPGSGEACTVQFSVVQPRTMTPVGNGFRVAIDPTVDTDHPAAHDIGNDLSVPGKPFFAGGGLREVTGQLANGVVTLPNPSAVFDMELVFGNAGAASAMIYRQCTGKGMARLFYVLTDPAKLSGGGEWLWAR